MFAICGEMTKLKYYVDRFTSFKMLLLIEMYVKKVILHVVKYKM